MPTHQVLHRRTMLSSFIIHAILVIAVIGTVTPLLYMVLGSFTTGKQLANFQVIIQPDRLSLEHYKDLFVGPETEQGREPSAFMQAFWRTFWLAVTTMAAATLPSMLVGFVVSRLRFKGRNALVYAMLVMQIFPAFMAFAALLVLYKDFGWQKTPLYLTFYYVAILVPVNVLTLRSYMRSIPRSLDEAAMIDGAGPTRIFFSILLPLSLPILSMIAISAFIAPWIDPILPVLMLSSKNQTVAGYLTLLTSAWSSANYNPLTYLAAGLVIGLPIMALQFYLLRFSSQPGAGDAEK